MRLGPTPPEDLGDEVGVYHHAVQDYVTNEPANDYTVPFSCSTASIREHVVR